MLPAQILKLGLTSSLGPREEEREEEEFQQMNFVCGGTARYRCKNSDL